MSGSAEVRHYKIHGSHPGSIELHFNEVTCVGDLFLIGFEAKVLLPITLAAH